ncbi:hypothetical protein [uncultured Arcobacter sp.]|uniref:hypothetical protein n=1 Tax=uncultured Arcobacter sp. TaxID=165434 RepID=UPI002609B971|nr:hypothetical protein [uncultured Arcobacter sp.]
MVKKKKKGLDGRVGIVNNLTKGTSKGTAFDKWLKANGVELDPPKESGDLIQDIKNRTVWLQEREKVLEGYMVLYRSMKARGASVYGQLMELDAEILEKKRQLKLEGKSPLDDDSLERAEKRKFEMIKFLDRMKFDIEKTKADLYTKSVLKEDEDVLFTVDAEYAHKRDKDGLHKD